MASSLLIFVTTSLMVQLQNARQLKTDMGLSRVYVFDKVHYFADAHRRAGFSYIYLTKGDEYAVLSQAAQAAFTPAEYLYYISSYISENNIGFYV